MGTRPPQTTISHEALDRLYELRSETDRMVWELSECIARRENSWFEGGVAIEVKHVEEAASEMTRALMKIGYVDVPDIEFVDIPEDVQNRINAIFDERPKQARFIERIRLWFSPRESA